jgi:iron(III) transport system substrate-binding protein
MQRIRVTLALAVGLAAAGACAPAAPARPAAPPQPAAAPVPASAPANPALERVVAGARSEGALTLVWSDSSLGGQEGAQKIVDLINQRHNLQIKLSFTPGPSMPEMAIRMTQERAAGRPATSDVFLGREANVKALMEHGTLLPVDWPALTPHILPSMMAPDNVAAEVAAVFVGVTYNTQLVPRDRVPRVAADVLRPEWRGKYATPPYPQFLDVLGSPEVWGPERTIAFTRDLANQAGGMMRCGETERIISGEFPMLVFDCGSGPARVWSLKGAPVASAIISDAAAILYYYVGVPQHAAHPNAATLFVREALSPEAQEVIWDLWGHDHHKVAGARSAKELQEAEARGAKFVEANVQFMMSYPEQEFVRKQTEEILRQWTR